jgi:hypothetical protein
MADNLKEYLEQLEKQLKEIGVASASIQDITNNFKNATDAATALSSTVEETYRIISENSGTDDDTLDKKRQAIAAAKLALSIAERQGQIDGEKLEQQKLLIKEMQSSLSLEEKKAIAMQKSLDKLIGTRKEAIGLTSHLEAISQIWNKMSSQEALERVINKVADSMAKFTNAIVKASLELDAVSAKVAKATSTTQFAQPMEELRTSALAAGVSVEELGDNFIALNNNYSNFNRLDQVAAKQLADTSMRLNAAGFSAEAFARSLDIGVKSLNMSETQVETFSKELVSFGKASGISMDRLSRDLISVGPKLVTFGTQGQRIFKEMSLAAKNLGIEMDRMFGITEQYTTFEGAAGAAAKLNSILGGNFINSLDLMNAALDNPAEAFRLIKDSMDASGKSFDDMTPAMKRTIAEAAGFSDVNEAARAFNNSIDENSESLEEQAISQEKLNEMNRSFLSLQEKINKLLAQMTPVIKPVIDFLGKMVDGLAQIVEKDPGILKFFGYLSAAFMGLGALAMGVLTFVANIVLVGKAFQAISSPVNFIGSFFKKTGDDVDKASNKTQESGKKLGETLKNISEAVKNSWKEILAFGGAVALIGVGIAAASLGLAELVSAFSALSGEQVIGAIAGLIVVMTGFVFLIKVFAAAIVTLGASLLAASPGILAFGAAIGLIGAGIGLAAFGVSKIFESIAKVDAIKMLLIGPALLGIAAGIAALTASGAVSGVVGGIGSLFGAGPLSVLQNMSNILTETFVKNLSSVAASLASIVESLKTNVEFGLVAQLQQLEQLSPNLAFSTNAPAASATPQTISVQDIIVKNVVRTEEGSALSKQEPINISISVPVKIEGTEFKNIITKISKDEIQKASNTKSAINVQVG